jgi:hypothetical protein
MLRVVKSKKCEILCWNAMGPILKKKIFFLFSFMLRVVKSKKCEIPCWNAMGSILKKMYFFFLASYFALLNQRSVKSRVSPILKKCIFFFTLC